MIRDTYLACSGHFTTHKHQLLRWVVDFKDPDVKRQLKEAFLNGEYEGKININGKVVKWSLKYFNIQNVVFPGEAIPVTFDMLTPHGKELIINKMIDDFWIASFNISGDNILDPEKLLADKDNCLGELKKAFNNRVGYIEELIPFIPDKYKYDKKFMRKVLEFYKNSVNSERNHIDNAIAILKFDMSFIDYVKSSIINLPEFNEIFMDDFFKTLTNY